MMFKNQLIALISILICFVIMFVCVVSEVEETKRVISNQEPQAIEIALNNCYDEYDSIEGVCTVDIIEGLTDVETSIEEGKSKQAIVRQIVPLFEEINKLGLNDKPLIELLDVVF